jgi:hypothetical protein
VTYVPPRHILLRRHTDSISNVDLIFFERALQRQLNDVAKYYELRPPGVSVVPPEALIPVSEAVGIDFLDDDGVEGAAAHHGWMPLAMFPWSLVGVKEARSWTMAGSHEAIEMFLNLRLDRWATAPNGDRWPYETADAVEAHGYPVGVEMWGHVRDMLMSNYVLPSFWQADGKWPFDFLGVLTEPFSLAEGGYARLERGGQLISIGGSRARERPMSRAARISGGRPG